MSADPMFTLRRFRDTFDGLPYWVVSEEGEVRQMHFHSGVFGFERAKELGMEACRRLNDGEGWQDVIDILANKTSSTA